MHFDYLLVFILDDPERVDDNFINNILIKRPCLKNISTTPSLK
jgi:hypothetical protein